MIRTIQLHEKIKEFRMSRGESNRRVDIEQVTPMELRAMRYLRQMKPNELSRIIGMNMDQMLRIENSNRKFVPVDVAEKYVVAMDILPNEHLKLRALINGETDDYIVNRNIPTRVKREVFERCDGKCSNCGSEEDIHYHHIKRFAAGGKHTVDNLTLLCSDCHIKEHEGERIYNAMRVTYK